MSKKTPMTAKTSAKIQRDTAKANGGQTPKGSFASRTQRVIAKRGK